MIMEHRDEEFPAAKYVNHELSMTLDSTDAFEGPEKLLEIWYAPSKDLLAGGLKSPKGLRAIPRTRWEEVLDHVHCKVLSVVQTEEMDAYVLSESSLFVFPHKVILKTCGTTTTLAGIAPLQDAVAQYVGYPRDKQPWRVFYSRKSFMFPERQVHPHTSWADEVAFLDAHYDNGTAYIIGNVNADHWYLYATRPQYFDPELRLPVNGVDLRSNVKLNDQTLEILMTDLSPVHASQFFTERLPTVSDGTDSMASSVSSLGAEADDSDPGHVLGNVVTKSTGIDQIYPTEQQIVDSFCFSPCGYSCNGLVKEGYYFTIHVTPERHCSYASFETNVPPSHYGMNDLDVLDKVVEIFRPGKFSVTLFDSEDNSLLTKKMPIHLASYKRTEKISYELDGYNLVFLSFEANRAKDTAVF
uniref:adenosylmethionine decarboxylase n=1 Tax=Blastobotrys adeninivorans TaxID=409370 RepID=A0A060TBN8_BLAAD